MWAPANWRFSFLAHPASTHLKPSLPVVRAPAEFPRISENEKTVMRAIIPFIKILTVAASVTTVLAQVPGNISWLTNLEEAKNRASRENRLILVDFWAEWCGPCLRMDGEVWNQPAIGHLASKFVLLRVDVDREEPLTQWYQVDVIPAVLLLDSFGNKLAHVVGYRSSREMEEIMKALPEDFSNVYDLLRKAKEDGENADVLIDLADRYRFHGFHLVSNQYYKKASGSREVKDDPRRMDHIRTFSAVNFLLIKESKRARKLFEKCLKKSPGSRYRPLHLFGLVKANLDLKNRKKARKYFAILKKEFGDDQHTMWAGELLKQ
ncbi:MAG: thioredoxin family protein [Fidelibacterota bacterium]